MNPVTAYIDAVRRAAPSGPAGAVAAARASAALVGRIEARKTALGRDLIDAEIDEEIRALGDPADVARRYAQSAPRSHELIDRYIASVKRQLPEKTATDIAAELRDALAAKVEGREEALGRALDKNEVADILKSFGSPMLVAHRYKGTDYLIGPKVYPYFWPTARLAVGVIAAIAMIATFVRGLVADAPMRFIWQGLGAAWNASIFAFGVVVIVFIAIERSGTAARLEAAWNPRQLPREQVRGPRSRFESLVALFFDGVAIAWWLGVVKVPAEWSSMPMKGGQAIPLAFSPVWEPVFWPILGLMLLGAAIHFADIIHPGWSRVRAVVSMAGHLGGLAVVWALLQGGLLVHVADGVTADAERITRLVETVNMVFRVSLWFLALGLVIAFVIDAVRLAKTIRLSPTAAPAL